MRTAAWAERHIFYNLWKGLPPGRLSRIRRHAGEGAVLGLQRLGELARQVFLFSIEEVK